MLDLIKQHLRIDEAEDDQRLLSLISDAEFEIKHSTGFIVKNNPDEYIKTTIVMIVKVSNGDFDDDPRAKESIENAIKTRLFKIKRCYSNEEEL